MMLANQQINNRRHSSRAPNSSCTKLVRREGDGGGPRGAISRSAPFPGHISTRSQEQQVTQSFLAPLPVMGVSQSLQTLAWCRHWINNVQLRCVTVLTGGWQRVITVHRADQLTITHTIGPKTLQHTAAIRTLRYWCELRSYLQCCAHSWRYPAVAVTTWVRSH